MKSVKKPKSRKPKSQKTKSRKSKRGGTLEELEHIIGEKTIVLMGETHAELEGFPFEFFEIIQKQKNIIDIVASKLDKDSLRFYSEAPEDTRRQMLTIQNVSSAVVLQYAQTKLPIQLSTVTLCDRMGGSCDEEYAADIVNIFIKPEVNCIIAQVGLFHVVGLRDIIRRTRPDIKVIIINTVSDTIFPRLSLTDFLKVLDIRKVAPSYLLSPAESEICKRSASDYTLHQSSLMDEFMDSSNEPLRVTRGNFEVEVLRNKDGHKIYKCPLCHIVTGTYAAQYPENTSYFSHLVDCPNTDKVPIEPSGAASEPGS